MERTTNAKPETVTTEPKILTPALRSVLATSDGRIEPDVLYDTMQAAQILGISARSLERSAHLIDLITGCIQTTVPIGVFQPTNRCVHCC